MNHDDAAGPSVAARIRGSMKTDRAMNHTRNGGHDNDLYKAQKASTGGSGATVVGRTSLVLAEHDADDELPSVVTSGAQRSAL